MTAGAYTIVIEKGATYPTDPMTWKDSSGNAIDLTGYTARLQMREIDNVALILTLTTENGGITLGGTAGTIVLNISAATTSAITQSDGIYDLEVVSSSGTVTRLLEGSVQFRAEVTR